MSLWRCIVGMFWDRRPPPEAVQAKAVASRLSAQADRLNEHLSQYQKARDPFAAIMADFYNRDQVGRIWQGRPHD